MSSRPTVEPLQPPILAKYGSDYLQYTSHYLFYLRLRLSLDRDPIRLKRVRSRRHRYSDDTSYTRKVVPRIMTVEQLYERFQPKFTERIIGADHWMEHETSFGLPMLFLPEPETETPAPFAELVDDQNDEGCMPQDAAIRVANDDQVTMLGEDEWIHEKVHEEPVVHMQYVKLTKNELFKKFAHATTAQRFKRAWDKDPRFREGHPVYADLMLAICEAKDQNRDPRTDRLVLSRLRTWKSIEDA